MVEFSRDEEIRMFALDRAAALSKGIFVFGKPKSKEEEGEHAELADAAGATLAVAKEFERYINGKDED